MQYLDRYTPEQARRHEVKPGITGWAQVNGRNALTWEEKFKLDVWYVDNWSFWLDLNILGLNAYHGDSSACIVIDGQLAAAIEEKRFRRINHWEGFLDENRKDSGKG